jgi:uncharacterized repeat protein (TIGR02543 family)
MKKTINFLGIASLVLAMVFAMTACGDGSGGTTYTVTYNGNGNNSGAVPTDSNSPYTSGANVTVLGNTGNLTKTDNTFNGWNTAAAGNGTAYAAGETFAITANTVLYAQWTSTIYTVTYNGNGNTGGAVPTDSNSPYASGANVTVLGNTGSLEKTGYIFSGWNTAAAGNGTAYAADETFAITANTVLYAQWTPTTYTVTYNGNGNTGGTVPIDNNSPYASGASVTVLGNTGSLVKRANTFDGWTDGYGTFFKEGETFAISKDTELYAVWYDYKIGDTGPGGGIIIYKDERGFTMTDDNTIAYYLEAAPDDAYYGRWASNNTITSTGMDIGTGRKNTANILINHPDDTADKNAAKACVDYRGPNNLIDWYLPSRSELNIIYERREICGTKNDQLYWSSSEYGVLGTSAYGHYFANNQRDYWSKDWNACVRAVRAF